MRVSNVKIEDRILLGKACNDGCQASLAEIHREYRASILAYLKKRLPNHNITEDIMQEVFRQILEGKCSYAGSGDPQNYLIGIARTLLNKELNKEKAAPSVDSAADLAGLLDTNTSLRPIERLEAVEFRQDLRAAISKLSSKQRRAVESVYIAGESYTEAAKELGCNYETIRKRIRDALDELKKEKFS